MQPEGIDWYSVSKLTLDDIDLHKFHDIVSRAHPELGIDRVSFQYRKKLLLLFQNASRQIKGVTPDLIATNSQLQVKRSIVVDKLHSMEAQVEQSFKEIGNMKLILAERKRLMAKLKDKVIKKKQQNAIKVYCCTVCNREEFNSLEAFKAHLDREHQDVVDYRSNTSNQLNDFKDLLLTMKDKEMEMMSMFLRASRDFQTQQLDRDYEREYKKVMQVSGAKTEESKEEQVEPQELKGESQFLFFQKSQQFRRQMERDQQFRRKLNQQKSQKQALNNEFYQPKNYYNVFGSVEENTSQHMEESRPQEKQSQEKEQQSYGYYDPVEFLSRFIQKHQNISSDSRCTLIENTPKPYVELRQATQSREDTYVPTSISDRLHLDNKKKTGGYETMYSTKRKMYEEKGYAFNSGPLLDDDGEGSDYQDYFGKGKTLNVSIQDQEIRANPYGHNISYYVGSKDSLYLSKLLSPKNQSSNSLLDKSLKEKSSELIDLSVSDSFSKRDFQISKDDETINLSDLKLSKLEKKKEEDRLNRNRQRQKLEDKVQIQPLKETSPQRLKESYTNLLANFEKKLSVGAAQPVPSRPLTNILKEFQRPNLMTEVEQRRPSKGNKRQLDKFIRK